MRLFALFGGPGLAGVCSHPTVPLVEASCERWFVRLLCDALAHWGAGSHSANMDSTCMHSVAMDRNR